MVYYLTHLLKYEEIDPEIETKKTNLRNRILDTLKKMNVNKYNLEEVFSKPLEVDVFSHFNGKFESGIENIFQGVIPKDMTEEELYKVINTMKNEIKHLKI